MVSKTRTKRTMQPKQKKTSSAGRRAKSGRPGDSSREDLGAKRQALRGVIDEGVRLHFRLGALIERVHHGRVLTGVFTAGRRAILRNLVELGPKTVPELAGMRPISRQYVQVLVNGLRDDGLVELIKNPAHKRSKLVRITEEGRSLLREMLEGAGPPHALS